MSMRVNSEVGDRFDFVWVCGGRKVSDSIGPIVAAACFCAFTSLASSLGAGIGAAASTTGATVDSALSFAGGGTPLSFATGTAVASSGDGDTGEISANGHSFYAYHSTRPPVR